MFYKFTFPWLSLVPKVIFMCEILTRNAFKRESNVFWLSYCSVLKIIVPKKTSRYSD